MFGICSKVSSKMFPSFKICHVFHFERSKGILVRHSGLFIPDGAFPLFLILSYSSKFVPLPKWSTFDWVGWHQLPVKYWRVMLFLNQMNNTGVRLHYLTPASPMPVRKIMRENPVKRYFHMTNLVLNFCQCNLYLYFWDCMHVTADKYSPYEYISYEYGIF